MSRRADSRSRRVVRILEWPVPDGWSDFGYGGEYDERLAWRAELSHRLKADVLERMVDVPGVEVSNELIGTTQAIVSALPETWDVLVGGDNPVIPGYIRIRENDRVIGPAHVQG